MTLLSLAPDIQEKILCWSLVSAGKDPMSERGLRLEVAELGWGMFLVTRNRPITSYWPAKPKTTRRRDKMGEPVGSNFRSFINRLSSQFAPLKCEK
jgi:hypothetical protein